MSRNDSSLPRPLLVLLVCAAAFLPSARAGSDQPHWIRIISRNFSVATDADEKRGHDVVVRFEQMRSVFGQLLGRSKVTISEPVDILALRSDDEYAKVAPIRQGQPVASPSFFVPGQDRNYFVLNVSKDESWRAISHDFAHVLLNYNYPQTQAWFDEGFAEYFSSLRIDGAQAQVGGDPEQLSELLSTQTWVAIPDLFKARGEISANGEGSRRALFNAQSWIVMHYLLTQNKLPETGAYFDLVQNQQVPVEEAIQKAYGVTSAQFAQAVKDYFHSLAPPSQTSEKGKQTGAGNSGGIQSLSVSAGDEIGSSTTELLLDEGQSLVAEMSVRLPEHRAQAMQELEAITGQPKTDNVIARRALAWARMDKKEYDRAVDDLSTGAELNIKDPWLHYYLALVKHDAAQSSGHAIEGLPNMMQDLHMVLDWYPEFAEARNMLAMAQLEGGGVHAAMDTMRVAIQLSPRNQNYLLNMAQIYLAGQNWDAATAMLERLKSSSDAQIAKSAREQLDGLPMLKKYGVPPKSASQPQPATTAKSSPSGKPQQKPNPQASEDSSDDDQDHPPAQPQIDKRAILYVKGKLVSVDCSQTPSAILTVSAGSKLLKLRTEDYKSLTLVGADAFSCDWESVPVAVNYKAGGKTDGDLVSVEVQ